MRSHPSTPARVGWALIVALALVVGSLPTTSGAGARSELVLGPGDTDPALYTPVLADQRDEVYAETAGRLSRYRIEATFTPAGAGLATIDGALDLNFYNDTGETLNELYFRLYPNGQEYGEGGMTLGRVTAGGDELSVRIGVADTVAKVFLAAPLGPERTLDLAIPFTTTIPTDPANSYGMFAFNSAHGSYALAHWLPLLAGWDPVDGWLLDPLSVYGDPVFTNTALFDVTIAAPRDLVFVTTGSEVSTIADEPAARRRYVSGPVRDFVMAVDDDFASDSMEIGGTTVTSYFNPADESGGLSVLVAGAQAVELYNAQFGPYPYEEIDLVQVPLGGGAAGVEFPQLMFIGGDHYDDDAFTRRIPGFLEFVVVHEVAHQWWYGLVGNNQYQHAFIDEGLTNYVSTRYFFEEYGEETGQEQLDLNLKLPYFSQLFGGSGDQIVDQPTDNFPSVDSYGTMIYGKAALGFDAIYNAIGDDAFYAALKDYVDRLRFEVATPADLRAAFERASGQDLTELWRHWFEAAEGDQDFDAEDLTELLERLGG